MCSAMEPSLPTTADAAKFPGVKMPYQNAVRDLTTMFRKTGSVHNAPKSGRPSTPEEKMLEVQAMMLQSPKKSVRRLAQWAHMSIGAAHKILWKSQHMFPYKISVLHELIDTDCHARVNFCNWFLSFLQDNGEGILDTMFFTDKAWFHLSGYVNGQNSLVRTMENSHEFKESPLRDQKDGVCCAMTRRRIIGLIFFHDTINAEGTAPAFWSPSWEN